MSDIVVMNPPSTKETSADEAPIQLPPLSCSMESSAQSGNRRFNLRKRSVNAEREEVNMSSYNSAFLSSLFADVAKATNSVNEEEEGGPKDDAVDPRADMNTISVKRSRVSLTKSISRVGKSCSNFVSLFEDSIIDSAATTEIKQRKPAKCSVDRIDSLHFQLSCVANVSDDNVVSSSSSPKSVMSVVGIGNDAFPNLPASVSESFSSGGLTRIVDRAVSTCENSAKESYGWFVEMDDGNDRSEFVDPYNKTASEDLAFSAATAPKRNHLDDELEWAKAADTVDDVLGDFF